jgi:hypothetical protein
MNLRNKIFAVVLAAAITGGIRLAGAQTNQSDNRPQPEQLPQARPGLSASDVRQEVRQLASDLDNPHYDYSKVPTQLRQTFVDVRSVTQDMDPDQARQLRMELFQQVMPALQRNRERIQKAMEMAFLKDLQAPLGATDDEFAVIEPLLEKVVEAQREADGGTNRFRRFGQRTGANNRQTNQQQQQLSPVDQADQALQDAVDDPNSNADLIKTRLDTLRQAKSKAMQDLSVARDALRSVLTLRQEAVLVDRGLLD